MEIRLKWKYRRPGNGHQQHKGGSNNNAPSMGKHTPHPNVFAFKRNNYRCEPKWNPKEAAA